MKHLKGSQSKPAKEADEAKPPEPQQDAAPSAETPTDSIQQNWDTWRAQRKAIIHTVEVSPKFSSHAEQIVRGFRRGIYAGNVDFYVGRLEDWVAQQVEKNTPPPPPSSSIISFSTASSSRSHLVEPFLTHAILDMPSANLRVPHVAPLLKHDGILVVFMPSITQIIECSQIITSQCPSLKLEKVLELGTGISGGREWDMRVATKKSKADPGWADSGSNSEPADDPAATGSGSDEEGAAQPQNSFSAAAEAPKEVFVCRPLAGQIIGSGGFVGAWRKIQGEEF